MPIVTRGCERVVLAGDHCQLPPSVQSAGIYIYATEDSNPGLADPRLEVCYSHTRWSLALDSLTLIILTLALAPALTLAQALALALPQP